MHPRYSFLLVAALVGCAGSSASSSSDAGIAPAADPLVGKPCAPAEENAPVYPGGLDTEVSINPSTMDGGAAALCLVNHFRGRTTCPYGQNAANGGCETPEGKAVGVPVKAQCADRRADDVVIWSCRCAMPDGGPAECACPGDMECKELVAPSGNALSDKDFAGSYCIKKGTDYDPSTSCSTACDPSTHPCP